MMKKILFITWDGPQTSYMEGLFMPIFNEINLNKVGWQFHVIQFTWADSGRISKTQEAASKYKIKYHPIKVHKRPTKIVGSLYSMVIGRKVIQKYIKSNGIDVVIPRSTIPAFIIGTVNLRGVKLIFDADGLPIEERVDFSGLKKNSAVYYLSKMMEAKILKKADIVLTRSNKAIELHLKTIGEKFQKKFFVVRNGRDIKLFNSDIQVRQQARRELEVANYFVFVYAGSLGEQYCFQEMLKIFGEFNWVRPSKFLILTGDVDLATKQIPEDLSDRVILKTVQPEQVPFYLNASDLGFALRKPKCSMKGVAPIKLGEYLLCGLPVVTSKGIGDTEELIEYFPECYFFDHVNSISEKMPEIIQFIQNTFFADRDLISTKARSFFSLQKAAQSYIDALQNLDD
ncbi:glycosyltransferase [Niabella terrae]